MYQNYGKHIHMLLYLICIQPSEVDTVIIFIIQERGGKNNNNKKNKVMGLRDLSETDIATKLLTGYSNPGSLNSKPLPCPVFLFPIILRGHKKSHLFLEYN